MHKKLWNEFNSEVRKMAETSKQIAENMILILFRFRTDLMNYPLTVTQVIGLLTVFIPLSKDIRFSKKNYRKLLKNTYKYCVRKIIVTKTKLKTKEYQK